MTIKNNLLFALVTILFSVFFASCDKLEGPYIIENKPVDTSACPIPEFPVVTKHIKRAFLEDYTGRKCVNCPTAGYSAHQMKEHYQDSMVLISVHAGYFAIVKDSELGSIWGYDFRTPAGTAWDEFFKVGALGNPNGMVNRKGYPANQQVLAPGAWANAVKATIAETPLMDLQIIPEYNAAEDKLCIHTKTTYRQSITGRALNLSVIIVEDSIIQAQKNNNATIGTTPDIVDYVHMHVMRGAVNDTWGTNILAATETSPASLIKTFQTKLTGFNLNTMAPENCHVVAFIFDADTKEVLQVAESSLTE